MMIIGSSCVCGMMVRVISYQEISHLLELEETTLSSDLSQGYALKMLTGESARDYISA